MPACLAGRTAERCAAGCVASRWPCLRSVAVTARNRSRATARRMACVARRVTRAVMATWASNNARRTAHGESHRAAAATRTTAPPPIARSLLPASSVGPRAWTRLAGGGSVAVRSRAARRAACACPTVASELARRAAYLPRAPRVRAPAKSWAVSKGERWAIAAPTAKTASASALLGRCIASARLGTGANPWLATKVPSANRSRPAPRSVSSAEAPAKRARRAVRRTARVSSPAMLRARGRNCRPARSARARRAVLRPSARPNAGPARIRAPSMATRFRAPAAKRVRGSYRLPARPSRAAASQPMARSAAWLAWAITFPAAT